jgi:hypothetical protein
MGVENNTPVTKRERHAGHGACVQAGYHNLALISVVIIAAT